MKHNTFRQQSPTTKKGRYLSWQTRFLCASMKWPRSWEYRYAHLFPTRQVEMADKLDSLKNEKGV